MKKFQFITGLLLFFFIAGHVWANSTDIFSPGHVFLMDTTWHDSDIHEYDQNGNFVKSFKSTLAPGSYMSGAGHIRWGKDGHLYTYGEYNPGTGWVYRQQGVFEWGNDGSLIDYYERDVTDIDDAGRGFEVADNGKFYIVDTIKVDPVPPDTDPVTVNLLRQWDRDFSFSESFNIDTAHKPSEAIIRYGSRLYITGNHDVAIFDTTAPDQAGFFATATDNNHINVSPSGIIAVNQQWRPPEGTLAYVELYDTQGGLLGTAVMPDTGNVATQYCTKGMAFDNNNRLFVTVAEWERLPPPSPGTELSHNVAVFNPDFTFEKMFFPSNVTNKYANIAIAPSLLPPSTTMETVTVRGQSYSAVGYDYGELLADGQNFQNCVFDPDTGHLFVIDNNNTDQGFGIGETDQVIEIDPSNGRVLRTIDLPSDSLYSYCLTLGETGRLLFAERSSDIYEINQETGDWEEPYPAAFQRDGITYNPNTDTYYVTEGNFSSVTRDSAGAFVVQQSYDTKSSDCNTPRGIVYEPNTDSLLMIDDSTDRVYEFGLDGLLIAGGGTRTVEMPEDITQASGIAFDPLTGRIFITGNRSRAPDPVRAKLVVLTPKVPVVPGDLDGTGAVDRKDIITILGYIGQPVSECPECDIDGDGRISVLDARRLVVLCTLPRCGTIDCQGFEKPISDLDATIPFTPIRDDLFCQYYPGPRHSTNVSFDLYLNDELVKNVGWVAPDGTSGAISLPADKLNLGVTNIIELRDPICQPGVGSCVDGQIISWAGSLCIFP